MAGEYADVGSSADYQFMDPNGAMSQANTAAQNAGSQYNAAVQSYDPTAYMNAFMNQAGGLSNLVSGQNSQLQQSLNALAAQQARQGGEAALAAMPGMRNSGAAMSAFGQAYATPFAQAQAQLQQNQLQGTLGLWNNAMGNNAAGYNAQLGANANLAANALNNQSQLAEAQSAWYTPTYAYQPGVWDYAMQGLGAVGNLAAGLTGMGGIGSLFSGLGNAVSGLNSSVQPSSGQAAINLFTSMYPQYYGNSNPAYDMGYTPGAAPTQNQQYGLSLLDMGY